MSSRQSKRFCFTWNNYDDAAVALLESFASDHCPYLVYGKEVGESGTSHLQGFFTLKSKKSITALRKLGLACHLETAKGTSLQASDYCKKEGDFVEFGTPPIPGQRTDLAAVADMVKAGKSLQEIAESCPSTYMKYGRGIRDLKLILDKPYDHSDVRGIWYVGSPGTGKSRKARHENPGAYLKSQSKWFDGYNGESVVILDDLDTNILGHHLKIWADRYSCTGETKGGTINLRHTKFIVTSNYTIEHLWSEDVAMQEAIKRRFKVTVFKDPFKVL